MCASPRRLWWRQVRSRRASRPASLAERRREVSQRDDHAHRGTRRQLWRLQSRRRRQGRAAIRRAKRLASRRALCEQLEHPPLRVRASARARRSRWRLPSSGLGSSGLRSGGLGAGSGSSGDRRTDARRAGQLLLRGRRPSALSPRGDRRCRRAVRHVAGARSEALRDAHRALGALTTAASAHELSQRTRHLDHRPAFLLMREAAHPLGAQQSLQGARQAPADIRGP